ncbi:MAG: sel1 repeat family protein, partial [Hyphomicrobiales bacterium]|nr:sel1 repeat family protein [Hyphomicrobiales bacterium]
SAIERALAGIAERIDSSLAAALDAAARVARSAAQDAVDKAFAERAPSPQIASLAEGLGDLRRQHEESGRNVHATLAAVRDAIDELARRPGAPAPFAPPMDRAPQAAPVRPVATPAMDAPAPLREAASQRPPASVPETGKSAHAFEPFSAAPAAPAVEIGDADELDQTADDFLLEPNAPAMRATRVADAARRIARSAALDAEAAQADGAGARDHIAAARRAAQIAAQKAADAASERPAAEANVAAFDQARAFVNERRRPILLGLLMLAVCAGGFLAVRGFLHHGAAPVAPVRSHAAPKAPGPGADARGPAPKRAASIGGDAAKKLAGGYDMLPTGAITPLAPAVAPPPKAPLDLATLKAAAAGGSPAAQYLVAVRYATADGVARDLKASADLFAKAAAQGLAPAQFRLGLMYERGEGVARDYGKARDLYEKAARAGNVHAMYNLGVLTAEAPGGKPDYAGAVDWFRKASGFGLRDAQYNLGVLLARGLGAKASAEEAWMYFELAAAQGDPDAAKKAAAVASGMGAGRLETARAMLAKFVKLSPAPTANDVAPEDVTAPASADAAPAKATAM